MVKRWWPLWVPTTSPDSLMRSPSGGAFSPSRRGDEAGVVVVGDEADLLAVGLVEDGEVEALGDRPDLGLMEAADGEEHAGEFVPLCAEEDIGLVFAVVEAAEEGGLAVDLLNAGVVAAGDEVGVDLACVVVELAELEPVVAADAGVGRAARGVLGREVVHDAAEVLAEVDDVEGDAELCGDEACVGGV